MATHISTIMADEGSSHILRVESFILTTMLSYPPEMREICAVAPFYRLFVRAMSITRILTTRRNSDSSGGESGPPPQQRKADAVGQNSSAEKPVGGQVEFGSDIFV